MDKPRFAGVKNNTRLLVMAIQSGSILTNGFFCTAIYITSSPVVNRSTRRVYTFSTAFGSCSSRKNFSIILNHFFEVQKYINSVSCILSFTLSVNYSRVCRHYQNGQAPQSCRRHVLFQGLA